MTKWPLEEAEGVNAGIGAVGDNVAINDFMVAHGLAQAHAAVEAGDGFGEHGCAGFHRADLFRRNNAIAPAGEARWATP